MYVISPLLYHAGHLMFLMLAGHALADRPLQEGAIRTEKNSPRDKPGDHRWLFGISCHGLIHGGFVAVITGLWPLGVAEAISHACIDEAKCRRKIDLITDQSLHVFCKVVWTAITIGMTS